MKISKDDHFILSTGKEFYAHGNILGISESNDVEYFYNGYDGGDYFKDFTNEELKEIADYMIEQWNNFKNKHS